MPYVVVGIRFDAARVYLQLADGSEHGIPLRRLPRLAAATPRQRANWVMEDSATCVHWPDLDEDVGVASFLGVPEEVVERAAGLLPPR